MGEQEKMIQYFIGPSIYIEKTYHLNGFIHARIFGDESLIIIGKITKVVMDQDKTVIEIYQSRSIGFIKDRVAAFIFVGDRSMIQILVNILQDSSDHSKHLIDVDTLPEPIIDDVDNIYLQEMLEQT